MDLLRKVRTLGRLIRNLARIPDIEHTLNVLAQRQEQMANVPHAAATQPNPLPPQEMDYGLPSGEVRPNANYTRH